jgi:hypothetical protein
MEQNGRNSKESGIARMHFRSFHRQAHCASLLAAFGCAVLAAAQNPSSAPLPGSNDDWLAQTGKMYYSSAVGGLKGFDCQVRPNWQALYSTQNGGQLSAADQARVTLLSTVKIALHARMDGGSVLDWNPPGQQLDADQTKLLSKMHGALDQTLQGFMQFWTPFISRQVIPDSSSGLEMTATDDGGKKVHLVQPSIELWETFDSGRILRQYNVAMTGTKVEVTPTYSPSDHGLVISHFHAFIRPPDETQKVQEMNVDISYQWLEGFPIPAHLDMDVVGVAELIVPFENCTVQR